MEHVVLVDEQDNQIGIMEKMEAHYKGVLHRAFSVFVFNSKHELLLQRRALGKYHSGGLWTNTCCSHSRVGETTLDAGHRRLQEEMGFDCPLSEAFTFIYKKELDHQMIEHEYDHVLVGTFDGEPILNPEEAMDYSFVSISEIESLVAENPQNYTEWFKICLKEVLLHYDKIRAIL